MALRVWFERGEFEFELVLHFSLPSKPNKNTQFHLIVACFVSNIRTTFDTVGSPEKTPRGNCENNRVGHSSHNYTLC